MNSIFVIAPYRYLGMWVFDDEKRGLIQEPFVGGADDILDRLTSAIPNAESGFKLVFSAGEFPGSTLHFELRRAELGGNVYYSKDLSMEGWLCPALLRYFEAPPAEIFAKIDSMPST